MRDLDAGGKEITGEIQALHSRVTKLEQTSRSLARHKDADEELDKAWREWETTFDAIKDSVILTDSDFKIIQANLATSRLFDKPLDEIIGKTCYQLLHGTKRPPKECPLAKAKKTKKHEDMEFYLPQKGIWVIASVDPILDDQGEVSSAVHIIRDITDRKRAEELLRKQRDRAQKYLDVAGVILVAIDSEQRVGLINKKGCEILGYSEEEITAKNWFDNFIPKKIRDKVREVFENVMRGDDGKYEYCENPILTKSGEERLIAWRNTILRDDEGRVIAILSSGEDITEQKEAEKALRESEEKYRDLFENAAEAIITLDLNGHITGANKLIEKYGFKKEELLGKKYIDFVIEPSRPKSAEDFETLVRGSPVQGEMELITPAGIRVVEYRANPIMREGKVIGVQSILADITEQKLAGQKLLQDRAQLKSLASQLTLTEERERRRLAAELHDQISQSLVISKIKLEALRKSGHGQELDKALDEVCDLLGRTIQDTRTLTFDLSSPVLYELGFETAVSQWLTEQIQKKHGIKSEFEDDGRPKPLDDDIRVLLFRDVRELLINVVKHARAGKVKVSVRRVDDRISVRVEDNGVGFDPKDAASVSTKTGGFGLFSIRHRLEELGGHLEIESEPGCGCRVTMVAPLKQEKISEEAKDEHKNSIGG
jgi:PAS domain S-box-containing protein